MPTQLTDRRDWTCPDCGRSFRVPHSAELIRCACDARSHSTTPLLPGEQSLAAARRSVCSTCSHYTPGRCTYIDWGCGCTFEAWLRDASKDCPQHKWLDPLALIPITQERRLICRGCRHFADGTCTQLTDYSQQLEQLGGRCPLSRWEVAWREVEDPIAPRRPRLVITLAVGSHARELLDITAPAMRRYAQRCGADFVALINQTQDWWGLEKFRVQRFARRYEQTLFLDADVIVRRTAGNLFDVVPAAHVALHDDAPYMPTLDWADVERQVVMRPQRREITSERLVLNSGVVLCDAVTADVWQPPPAAFRPTHCAEQFWVESSALELPRWPLATRYNCQWWMPSYERDWPSADLVHLANCPPDRRLELAREIAAIDDD